MTWKQIDRYHLRNGDWTISKMNLANGSKYGLWQGNVSNGFYETADEAKEKHKELTKEQENDDDRQSARGKRNNATAGR